MTMSPASLVGQETVDKTKPAGVCRECCDGQLQSYECCSDLSHMLMSGQFNDKIGLIKAVMQSPASSNYKSSCRTCIPVLVLYGGSKQPDAEQAQEGC